MSSTPLACPIPPALEVLTRDCIDCGLCARDCAFLQRHGGARQLAEKASAGTLPPEVPWQCSLCGLCTRLCPKDLDPAAVMLELRRAHFRQGGRPLSAHRRILAYERRGASPRFSLYLLPPGCRTVLFPGCALPGTRPGRLLELLHLLRQRYPDLGLVLDCCHKPSHDLGREEQVERMFGPVVHFLLAQGVRRVLTACPNCQRMFSSHGGALASQTVYEELCEINWQPPHTVAGTVTIHDPCGVRMRQGTHQAVRTLTTTLGLRIEEMRHCREKTVCCGEGGSVPYVAPGLAGSWTSLRLREAAERRVVTYCAGCVGFLGRHLHAMHLLDMVFAPRRALAGRIFVARPPLTSLNRLWLKFLLRRRMRQARIGQRRHDGTIGLTNVPQGDAD